MKKRMDKYYRKALIKFVKKMPIDPNASWKKAGRFFTKIDTIDELVRLAQSEKARKISMSKDFQKELENIFRTGEINRRRIYDKKRALEQKFIDMISILDTINKKGFNIPKLKKKHKSLSKILEHIGILKRNGYIDEEGNITKKGKQFLEKYKHMLR